MVSDVSNGMLRSMQSRAQIQLNFDDEAICFGCLFICVRAIKNKRRRCGMEAFDFLKSLMLFCEVQKIKLFMKMNK